MRDGEEYRSSRQRYTYGQTSWETYDESSTNSSVAQESPFASIWGFSSGSGLEAHSLSNPNDWQIYNYQGHAEIDFVKHWPTQTLQTVVFQFSGLDYRRNPGQPLDTSLITYRGQTGFWFNGNVSFLLPIVTETKYTILQTDFTWPSFSYSEFSGGYVVSYYGKDLWFGAFSNEVIRISLESDKTITWPCHCDQSKVIIGAKIVPAIPNQSIEWSFVGESFGATISSGYPIGGEYPSPPSGSDFYATVTPGTEDTGLLKVRAKMVGYDCHADTEIRVRAVPTRIEQTIQNIQPTTHEPYTALFMHRFESSGGNLDGVQIWERVELEENPFQDTGYPIAYGETEPWILDSDGLMDEWDVISDPWNSTMRDLNRWIPSSCHAGLPVIMSTPQSFAWKCPLCDEYNEFETHDIHSGFNAAYSLSMCESLNNPEYVIVDNDSDHYDDYQSTPVPVLQSIAITPASIPADGTNTALVAVDCCWLDSPQGLLPPQQWSWAPNQDTLGCSYVVLNSCNAQITAGTQAGQVVIGLYADWQCNFKTATLTLTQP